jgi:hypothetical protein
MALGPPIGRNRAPDALALRKFRFPPARGGPAPDFAPSPGESPALPPIGEQSGNADFARLIFPPRTEKIPSSRDFTAEDYNVTLAAGAGNTTTSAGLAFQLPGDAVGWLQEFRLYVLSQTANTSASWNITINGGPISGFNARQNPPGVANLVLVITNEMRIRLPMGCLVQITVTNLNANGPWTVGGFLSGWYHPLSDELRVWGAEV